MQFHCLISHKFIVYCDLRILQFSTFDIYVESYLKKPLGSLRPVWKQSFMLFMVNILSSQKGSVTAADWIPIGKLQRWKEKEMSFLLRLGDPQLCGTVAVVVADERRENFQIGYRFPYESMQLVRRFSREANNRKEEATELSNTTSNRGRRLHVRWRAV